MIMLAILVLEASILGFSALAAAAGAGLAGRLNLGPHGLSEILYAATSATGNNGSAFAGLSANTVFYNVTLGLAMLIGRFLWIVPVMAVAGTMVRKDGRSRNRAAPSRRRAVFSSACWSARS